MALKITLGSTTAVLPFAVIFFIFVLCVLTLYCLGRFWYNLFLHPLRSYPGPLLWRMGSLPQDWHIFWGTLNTTQLSLHKKYGPVVRLSPNDLSYIDARVWKEVWGARSPEFPKDNRRTTISPNGFYHILNAPRDDHARFRRLLAHAFSEKGLREQEPRIAQYTDLLIDRLHELAGSSQSTDVVDWYTSTVFDVVGDLTWGESFHGLQNRKVHEWVPAILATVQFSIKAATLRRWGLGKLSSQLLSKETQDLRNRNFSLAADKTEKRAKYGGDPRGDFWDRVLIKSANENSAGEGMTKEEMINNATVLVLAGAETSATTLSGTTYLLLKNPHTLRRVVTEIRSTFKSNEEINLYSVNRLTYMSAVLDETMRVYPPVPSQSPRLPPKGGAMVLGEWIPEGTTIHLPGTAAYHVEYNFHRPDDFCPERWLPDAPSEFANDNKAAFQPFSAGNRNCIGMNLAYAEMRLILCKVLYNFNLSFDNERNSGDWLKQESYGVWFKGPLFVRLDAAQR